MSGLLNWQEVTVKGRSKKEIFRILVLKGKHYLPSESQSNQRISKMLSVVKFQQVLYRSNYFVDFIAERCNQGIRTSNRRTESTSIT